MNDTAKNDSAKNDSATGDKVFLDLDQKALDAHLTEGTTFEDFFARAEINPNVSLITGTVCGIRVEEVEDPLMQQIRWLDKLVDELARGRPMSKILRSNSTH